MGTDTHKEWTDALRESFPEEVRPADGGWEAVAGRLRRAAARRRAAIAAAVLALPLAGGVFFLTRPDAGQPLIDVQDSPGLVAQVAENRSEPAVLSDARSEHGGAANVPPVLTDASSEHGGAANVPPVLTDASSEHGGAANVPPVLTDASSEHGGAANVPPVLTDASSEHSGMANVPPVLTDARSEHGGMANVPPVLTDARSEHGGAANVPPVLTDARSEHGSAAPFGEDEAPARHKERRMSVGVNAASMAGGAPTSVTVTSMAGNFTTKASNHIANNFLSNSKGLIMQKEYVHDLPLSLGLTARYRLTDRLSLESGIEYTYLHSRLDDIHTVMHFAGVPLRLNYNIFAAGPVEFYAGIGGSVEKCIKASLGGMSVREPQLQWSGSFNLGAQSILSRNAWFYLQPDLSYYFTRTSLTTYRSENRLGLTFRAGILFNINH